VITYRPEFQPRWSEHGHVTALNLSKLTRAQSVALVSKLTAGKSLPAGLLEQIVGKTDGVPLFVEELTKSILESGNLKDEGDRFAYTGQPASVTIPSTLRDSLMARLDRVMPVKEIAQIGAAIGREFSYELISAVAPMSAAALDDGLARLTESGLAFRRGTPPQAVYVFKHALVQDAAYDSLLKSRRHELHGKIARVIEERFPAIRDTEPELLAQHYTAAGLNEVAVAFWQRAGELSMQRFALPEAIAHLREGLALLDSLPTGPGRDLKELELRTQLGPALVAVHGWAAPEVSDLLEPAWALARSLDHKQSYLPILHGLWVHFLTEGSLALSMGWAEQMLATATACQDQDLEISAHRLMMASCFWLGDLAAAGRHADIIESMYDPKRHWHIASLTNNDPLTAAGTYRAHYLWMLGYPDQAMLVCDAKDEHARRRNHPFDLGFALTLGSHAFDYCCAPERLLLRAEEAERVGRDRGVSLMSEVMAQIVKGVAWLRAGRIADSIGQLRESIGRLSETGHRIYVPYLRALLADAIAREGDLQGGLALIDESLAQSERQAERVHLAELLRLKGWILKEQGKLDDAEQNLRAALTVAREQQAKSWELRAATTLARLWQSLGRTKEARELLAPIYGWFTEGFDTKDLKEARALLDELA
jgi:predicted ATPase